MRRSPIPIGPTLQPFCSGKSSPEASMVKKAIKSLGLGLLFLIATTSVAFGFRRLGHSPFGGQSRKSGMSSDGWSLAIRSRMSLLHPMGEAGSTTSVRFTSREHLRRQFIGPLRPVPMWSTVKYIRRGPVRVGSAANSVTQQATNSKTAPFVATILRTVSSSGRLKGARP